MATNNAVNVGLSGSSGSGSFAGTTSPTFVTPVLGASTATSINFGGTTLSNYLDSTFVPVLNFGGANTGITYTTQLGTYSRIGNILVFQIQIIITSKGSSTGTATISGMPFAFRTSTAQAAFPVLFQNVTSATPSWASLGSGGTVLTLFNSISASAVNVVDNTMFTNTATINVGGSYLI